MRNAASTSFTSDPNFYRHLLNVSLYPSLLTLAEWYPISSEYLPVTAACPQLRG